MRHRALVLALLLAGALLPSGCSLLVAGELDGKSSPGPEDAGADAVDGADDAKDEDATDADVTDAPLETEDAVEDGPVEAADATDGGDATECQACPVDCCQGICTSLMTDPQNCGTCGNVCPASRACVSGECAGGFRAMSEAGAPEPRLRACAVWTGSELFVWGGVGNQGDLLNSGGAYDPLSDTWRTVGAIGAPTVREEPSCVAMGDDVFVWGGVDIASNALVQGGAIWSSKDNSWKAVSETDAPVPRRWPTVVWIGDKVLLWGGEKLDKANERSGALYDPGQDSWQAMTTTSSPDKGKRQAFVWTGTLLYVFGGRDNPGGAVNNVLRSYNPAHDVWSVISAAAPPSARSNAFAAWDGSKMYVWGGFATDGVGLTDGAAFDPAIPAWTALSTSGPPSARGLVPFRSGWNVWTGDKMLIVGGSDNDFIQPDSILYDPNAPVETRWSAPATWDPPLEHRFGIGVWSGREFILWGGTDGSEPVPGGTRWMP
jgi:N-acetylneuraminic acid mutarotase